MYLTVGISRGTKVKELEGRIFPQIVCVCVCGGGARKNSSKAAAYLSIFMKLKLN